MSAGVADRGRASHQRRRASRPRRPHTAHCRQCRRGPSAQTTRTLTQTQRGGAGLTCQRARGLTNNVIIDTLWCGFDTRNQAGDVVTKTATAISQA
jgi:hypothetical protein